MPAAQMIRRTRTILATLRRDRDGLALTEFALTLPLVIAIGGWGIELSNLALCNLRVSQYALNLADNASRVGLDNGQGVTQFREFDANDVLRGAKLQGAAIDLQGSGRVTLSSLEKVSQPYDGNNLVQRIHWQRCLGAQTGTGYDSMYAVSTSAGSDNSQANAGLAVPNGVGDAGNPVSAPDNSGVMFVEVNYLYKPIFGSLYVAPRIVHYTASLIVRDNRSFAQIYNPTPTSTAATCDKPQ